MGKPLEGAAPAMDLPLRLQSEIPKRSRSVTGGPGWRSALPELGVHGVRVLRGITFELSGLQRRAV